MSGLRTPQVDKNQRTPRIALIAPILVLSLFCSAIRVSVAQESQVDIRFDRSTTMSGLVTMLSDMGGLNVIATDSVAKMNVMVQARGVSARDLLRTVAEANAIKYIEQDNGVIVLMTKAEYVSGLGKSFDVRVYTLENVDVETAIPIVQSALSATGDIIANAQANQLVVMDELRILESLDGVIESIDRKQDSEVVELAYLSAENAASLIRGIVQPPGQVSYSPYERFLVISDTAPNVKQAKDLLRSMDVPRPLETVTFSLDFADSQEVGEAIRELFDAREQVSRGAGLDRRTGLLAPPSQGAPAEDAGAADAAASQAAPRQSSEAPGRSGARAYALGQEGSVVMDDRTNAVIVTAEPGLMQQISAIVQAMDVKLEPHTYRFQHADLANLDLETKLDGLLTSESEIYQVDAANTSVTFFTVRSKAAQILELLQRWDVEPVQVMIEARLLSVSNDTIERLGLNLSARNAETNDWNGQSIVNRSGEISLAPLFGPGAAFSELSVGSLVTSDYNVILRAIVTDSATRIVSQPRITTLNHLEAIFSDSRQEPYTVVTVEGDTNTVLEDVRFLDVGITLQVVPHVNEMGDVRLDITLLLSTLVEVRNGVPVVDTTRAQATSATTNGQPVLLGGLNLYELATTKSGVPFLSKVPLVGLPFRGRSKDSTDRQLLLVVTPHLLNEQDATDVEVEVQGLLEKFQLPTDSTAMEEKP